MKILWFTWKDREHPRAGGGEIVQEELAKRLVADGHKVIFIVPKFAGGDAETTRDGFKIIRTGTSATVYWNAYRLYKKHFQGWPDLVIDSYFVLPFFTNLYVKEQTILFVHNLCRVIWFYQMSFPASLFGYLIEPMYIRIISGMKAVTISESTKRDMVRFGFKPEKISIISEGIELAPVADLEFIQKYGKPTILALGSIRAMKRTDHIVRAFEIAKRSMPDLQLIVAGKPDGKYGARVLEMIRKSSYTDSIQYIGQVDESKKIELMQKSHIICVTSVKEGWGLIVTEANSQGTPAIVYDVDGLRDSVRHNQTGFVVRENSPSTLASEIVRLLKEDSIYAQLRSEAWQWSKEIHFTKSYQDFIAVIDKFRI